VRGLAASYRGRWSRSTSCPFSRGRGGHVEFELSPGVLSGPCAAPRSAASAARWGWWPAPAPPQLMISISALGIWRANRRRCIAASNGSEGGDYPRPDLRSAGRPLSSGPGRIAQCTPSGALRCCAVPPAARQADRPPACRRRSGCCEVQASKLPEAPVSSSGSSLSLPARQ